MHQVGWDEQCDWVGNPAALNGPFDYLHYGKNDERSKRTQTRRYNCSASTKNGELSTKYVEIKWIVSHHGRSAARRTAGTASSSTCD